VVKCKTSHLTEPKNKTQKVNLVGGYVQNQPFGGTHQKNKDRLWLKKIKITHKLVRKEGQEILNKEEMRLKLKIAR